MERIKIRFCFDSCYDERTSQYIRTSFFFTKIPQECFRKKGVSVLIGTAAVLCFGKKETEKLSYQRLDNLWSVQWVSTYVGVVPMGYMKKPVAQRQDVVSGTLALLWYFSESAFEVSRAADPKGTKSCRTQGESVRPSVCPSIRPSACQHLASLGQALRGWSKLW